MTAFRVRYEDEGEDEWTEVDAFAPWEAAETFCADTFSDRANWDGSRSATVVVRIEDRPDAVYEAEDAVYEVELDWDPTFTALRRKT